MMWTWNSISNCATNLPENALLHRWIEGIDATCHPHPSGNQELLGKVNIRVDSAWCRYRDAIEEAPHCFVMVRPQVTTLQSTRRWVSRKPLTATNKPAKHETTAFFHATTFGVGHIYFWGFYGRPLLPGGAEAIGRDTRNPENRIVTIASAV